MFVEELGQGTPVVFLHSSGLSGRQFKRLATMLSERGFRAILPDLGGHGKSPPIEEPTRFSFHEDVAEIERLLSQHDSAHIVAHSYGALVGLHVAMHAPEKIRSLALFEPVAFGILDPAVHTAECAELERAADTWGPSAEDRERWLKTFVDYWGGDGAWDAQREDARAEFRRIAWAVREGVRSLLDDRTPASAYRMIEAPALLMTAERSPLAARTVIDVLANTLQNARIVRFAGATHMAPLTHAAEVNRVIFDAVTRSTSSDLS